MVEELNCLVCGKHLVDLEKFEYTSRSNTPFGHIIIFACQGHWEEINTVIQHAFPGAIARRIREVERDKED